MTKLLIGTDHISNRSEVSIPRALSTALSEMKMRSFAVRFLMVISTGNSERTLRLLPEAVIADSSVG